MESVSLWPHLELCIHANPWVVSRNLEEGGDRMLSAIAVVSRIVAKIRADDFQDKCLSLHSSMDSMLSYGR